MTGAGLMLGKLKAITSYLAIALIAFIPFQTFLTEFLIQQGTPVGLTYYLMHWYEPIAVILLVLWLLLPKSRNQIWREPATYLIGLGMISAMYLSPDWQQGIQGFRLSLFALVIYLLVRLSEIKLTDAIVKLYLWLAISISGWGIVEQLLPHLYWSKWHILSADSLFGFGNHAVMNIYQSTSIFIGPNQLAGYLLPAVFILLANPLHWPKLKRIITLGIVLIALMLTFSRSALLGLIIGAIIYLWYFGKSRKHSFSLLSAIGIGGLIIAGVIFELNGTHWKELFLHSASTTGHWQGLIDTFKTLRERLMQPVTLCLGGGIGTAGPLALKYDGIISESWYLQLALELGLVGLGLWLFSVIGWLKQLYCRVSQLISTRGLWVGLIAVSVMALFLHPWADNPALAITLLALVGLTLNQKTLA